MGTTNVTVTATDAYFNQAAASFNVSVVDTTPPQLSLLVEQTIFQGTAFVGSGFATDAAGSPLTATVDYGDGSGVQPLALLNGKDFELSHIYQDDGLYTILATVTDESGNSTASAGIVLVLSPQPLGYFQSIEARERNGSARDDESIGRNEDGLTHRDLLH